MSVDMHDKTGELPSAMDCREAIAAVQQAMIKDLTKLPPYLAVQMANIHRCLAVASAAVKRWETPPTVAARVSPAEP